MPLSLVKVGYGLSHEILLFRNIFHSNMLYCNSESQKWRGGGGGGGEKYTFLLKALFSTNSKVNVSSQLSKFSISP